MPEWYFQVNYSCYVLYLFQGTINLKSTISSTLENVGGSVYCKAFYWCFGHRPLPLALTPQNFENWPFCVLKL